MKDAQHGHGAEPQTGRTGIRELRQPGEKSIELGGVSLRCFDPGLSRKLCNDLPKIGVVRGCEDNARRMGADRSAQP
jgi:hypothetical protein